MPLSRANAETLLVGRLGGKLSFVGKSLVVNGANPDLAMPLAMAASTLRYSVLDYANITDVDILPIKNIPAFLGLAELYTLRDIWGVMTEVTTTGQDLTQAWSSMSSEILQRITALEALYKTLLQAFAPIVGGSITINERRRRVEI